MPTKFFTNPALYLDVRDFGRSFSCLQKAADDFAVSLVFDTNHTGFANGGMQYESLFNLPWKDIFSAWAMLST
jgi:hypothetical protein